MENKLRNSYAEDKTELRAFEKPRFRNEDDVDACRFLNEIAAVLGYN